MTEVRQGIAAGPDAGLEDVDRSLLAALDRGETTALATVVGARGSVPREPGTRMLICRGGQTVGTIGGGCGEAEVMRQALDVLEGGRPRLLEVDLTEDISIKSQGICGGVMEVFLDAWAPSDRGMLSEFVSTGSAGRPAGLLTVVAAPDQKLLSLRAVLTREASQTTLAPGAAGERLTAAAMRAFASGRSQMVSDGPVKAFLYVPEPRPAALIVGAGHIAVPLARIAAMCGMRVVVLDDRPSFANAERFPQADAIIVGDFSDELRRFPIDEHTYVILITRGHQHDVPCLLEVLGRPAAYIGMIGSRRRVAGVFQLLREEHGIPAELLARVHSPIGLDIGSETPAEIAVSIMAEVIRARRRGQRPA